MRNERGGRFGGRNNNNRNNNNNRGRKPYNNNRGRYNNQRDPRAASESGNQRERIAVESGSLVIIDQFMLANPQFHEKLLQIIDDGVEAKDQLIQSYGGTVVTLEPGTYKIQRDPYAYTIIIHPEDTEITREETVEQAKYDGKQVLIDTRCLAMVDRELLDDTNLLEKYQALWFGNKEKACRDLIRDNGGAVRYGFNRTGDDLLVNIIADGNVVGLWPETIPAQTVSEEA